MSVPESVQVGRPLCGRCRHPGEPWPSLHEGVPPHVPGAVLIQKPFSGLLSTHLTGFFCTICSMVIWLPAFLRGLVDHGPCWEFCLSRAPFGRCAQLGFTAPHLMTGMWSSVSGPQFSNQRLLCIPPKLTWKLQLGPSRSATFTVPCFRFHASCPAQKLRSCLTPSASKALHAVATPQPLVRGSASELLAESVLV